MFPASILPLYPELVVPNPPQILHDGSLQWVGEAISRLTEEDIRAAKAMQEIMAGPLAQYGNEASMAGSMPPASAYP